MAYSSSSLYNAIIAYIIFVIIIVHIKPVWLYDYKKNRFKEFGKNEGQAFMSLHITCIVGSIVIYLLFIFMEILMLNYNYIPLYKYRINVKE